MQSGAGEGNRTLVMSLGSYVIRGEKEGLEEVNATNLLRAEAGGSGGCARRAFQLQSARSIMGATEKRRDGSGRVVAGVGAVSASIGRLRL